MKTEVTRDELLMLAETVELLGQELLWVVRWIKDKQEKLDKEEIDATEKRKE